MASTEVGEAQSRRHLVGGIQSTALSSVAAGVGSVIRIPLTIAAVGVSGYGALSTICALFGWVWFIPAGARNAGAAAAVFADHLEDEPTPVARAVSVESFRHSALVLVGLAVLVLVLPWHTLVDPDETMTRGALVLVLFACIMVGMASVPGAALLGVLTTRGRFRDQNVAMVVGICLTTALAAIGFVTGAGPGWFTVIWVASLAVPALPIAVWNARALADRRQRITGDVGSVSGSSLWIAAGQQFASGFDLVIISVILGSPSAAAYGLVSRLAQLALTPVVGAVPVLTRSAGRARATGLARARRTLRSTTLLVAAMQCAGLVVFVALGGWACRLLSGGHIAPSTPLLLATAGWAVTETARRCLMSASATPVGLRHWRKSNLGFAIPNLVLTVALTRAVGVSGPMWASLVAVGAMTVVASWRLGPELRTVLGR
jgi:hypothetical protein